MWIDELENWVFTESPEWPDVDRLDAALSDLSDMELDELYDLWLDIDDGLATYDDWVDYCIDHGIEYH
jgi:hypothetical protein